MRFSSIAALAAAPLAGGPTTGGQHRRVMQSSANTCPNPGAIPRTWQNGEPAQRPLVNTIGAGTSPQVITVMQSKPHQSSPAKKPGMFSRPMKVDTLALGVPLLYFAGGRRRVG